jgi:hypothetical protein
MKVFISWSGDRTKKVAEAFNEWLGQLVQATEPWMSPNIEKGKRWNDEIKKALGESKVGIICLDKDNLNSKWVLFEAGAIAKTDDAHPCTFLLDVNPSDVEPPLGDFQHTIFDKDDIRRLAHTINEKVRSAGEKTLDAGILNSLFDNLYPTLERRLKEILIIQPENKNVQRDERDILEEVLQIVRVIQKGSMSLNKDDLEMINRELIKKYRENILNNFLNSKQPSGGKNPFDLNYEDFFLAIKENRIRKTNDGLVVDDQLNAENEIEATSTMSPLDKIRKQYNRAHKEEENPKE